MSQEARHLDIDDMPELVTLAEEVRATNEPRILTRDGEDIAKIVPIRPATRRPTAKKKTAADWEAFWRSAGSWADMDTEKLKADIEESRNLPPRPPIHL
jgi:antitoxin (DNA-binding transcriptional repressor) of toxin-antitoxin stability system